MMPLKNAIKVARGWVYKDQTRRHLQGVVVEPKRVWATDGHRAIILETVAGDHALGVYLDDSDIPTPVEAIKPPPIDSVIYTKYSSPIVAQLKVEWVRRSVRGLVAMVNHRRTCPSLIFERDRIVKVDMVEDLTKYDERKGVKRAHLRMRVEVDEKDVIGIPYAWGLNPRYLVEAVEDLGFYSGNETFVVRQAKDGNYLRPLRIDGPRGFALIMPVGI